MSRFRWFSRMLFLAVLFGPAVAAQAAEVVFPTGSRIGIAPPPGVAVSPRFMGFEDAANRVAIMVVALPPEAYPELEKSTAQLGAHGATVERREDLSLDPGKGFLVVARQKVGGVSLHKWILAAAAADLTAVVTLEIPDDARESYPDAAIWAALASVAVRKTVPLDEQLSLLPFRMGELSGFQVGGIIAGRAVMLTDPVPDGREDAPRLVIALAPGGPAQPSDRDLFARDALASMANLADVRIVSSEPLRIGGQQGHQIMARGKDIRTGVDFTIVQWIRFGGGAYVQFVGTAPSAAWTGAYARFRHVRDGIELP
jgi:hypothetical protein